MSTRTQTPLRFTVYFDSKKKRAALEKSTPDMLRCCSITLEPVDDGYVVRWPHRIKAFVEVKPGKPDEGFMSNPLVENMSMIRKQIGKILESPEFGVRMLRLRENLLRSFEPLVQRTKSTSKRATRGTPPKRRTGSPKQPAGAKTSGRVVKTPEKKGRRP